MPESSATQFGCGTFDILKDGHRLCAIAKRLNDLGFELRCQCTRLSGYCLEVQQEKPSELVWQRWHCYMPFDDGY